MEDEIPMTYARTVVIVEDKQDRMARDLLARQLETHVRVNLAMRRVEAGPSS